jgi:hypothetical protein
MENEEQEKLNPWLSIWTEPRATIQQVVDGEPKLMVLILAPLAGIADALRSNNELAYSGLENLIGLVVAGGIGGYVIVFLGAYPVRWTGGWLGGTASLGAIRAAGVWSSVPKITSAVLLLLLWVVLSQLSGPVAGMEVAAQLMILTLGIWSFVLSCKCYGQVQGFSAWKGLANMLLSFAVVVVPILVIVAVAAALSN